MTRLLASLYFEQIDTMLPHRKKPINVCFAGSAESLASKAVI